MTLVAFVSATIALLWQDRELWRFNLHNFIWFNSGCLSASHNKKKGERIAPPEFNMN
jgi:hypothetical protein